MSTSKIDSSLFRRIFVWLYRLSAAPFKKSPYHVTRHYMYTHLANYHEARPNDSRVLSISHSQYIAKVLGYQDDQIIDASYPEYNVLDLPYEDGEFDAVVSDQVFEHIEGSPEQAMRELFRVLRPGGLALHTTCFINPIHGAPSDYWRFTPDALRLLVRPYASVVDVGGWGNRHVWTYVALGLRSDPVPMCKWHPTHWLATKNTSSWPIVTWVLARKEAAPVE